jgi:hypothetical protein
LRNRIYSGDFDFGGVTYAGKYEPIVSRDLWQRVQSVLDGRGQRRARRVREFAFSGLITCGHCGCALVGELKKGRYVYYHCTGYRGRCPERYVREEALEEKFTDFVRQVVFDDATLDWADEAVNVGQSAERARHEEAIARLRAEQRRLQDRLDAMYVDKLDGKIDQAFYERKADEWRAQQHEIERQIQQHEAEQGSARIDVADLAARAAELFAQQPPHEKRKLLDYLVGRCSWANGELVPTWRAPWVGMVGRAA